MFETLSRPWRYIGSVGLIAGDDLALSTVAPHRFLDFVSGRLARLFIDSDSSLVRSIAAFDDRRDVDGRFRINDFFCHADTWQAVLRRLIARTDVVLMDLRNFSSGNAGCAFEDLGLVHLVDERTGTVLTRLYPQDKTQNASGLRRTLSSVANGSATPMPTDVEPATGLPPLLVRMLDQQAATGLPPAYLPKDEEGETP